MNFWELSAQIQRDAKVFAEIKASDEADRAAKLRRAATKALEKASIPSESRRAALAFLAEQIGYSDNGEGVELVFRGHDGVEVDLEHGLSKWCRSAEARAFGAPVFAPPTPKPATQQPQSVDGLLADIFASHARGEPADISFSVPAATKPATSPVDDALTQIFAAHASGSIGETAIDYLAEMPSWAKALG